MSNPNRQHVKMILSQHTGRCRAFGVTDCHQPRQDDFVRFRFSQHDRLLCLDNGKFIDIARLRGHQPVPKDDNRRNSRQRSGNVERHEERNLGRDDEFVGFLQHIAIHTEAKNASEANFLAPLGSVVRALSMSGRTLSLSPFWHSKNNTKVGRNQSTTVDSFFKEKISRGGLGLFCPQNVKMQVTKRVDTNNILIHVMFWFLLDMFRLSFLFMTHHCSSDPNSKFATTKSATVFVTAKHPNKRNGCFVFLAHTTSVFCFSFPRRRRGRHVCHAKLIKRSTCQQHCCCRTNQNIPTVKERALSKATEGANFRCFVALRRWF